MIWDDNFFKIDWEHRQNLEEYIQEISKFPIYIYGAGCFGRELFDVFLQHGVPVQGYLDSHAEECAKAEVPIHYPDELQNKKNITLVIGIVLNLELRLELTHRLQEMGYDRIIDGQSVRAHYVYPVSEAGERSPKEYFQKFLPEIREVASLFIDTESQLTFKKNLLAHISRDYSDCQQTHQKLQYFVDDIPFSKGFTRFVDCGAYIGDTLRELCDNFRHIDEVTAFEPNLENFSRLSNYFDLYMRNKIGRADLFPCGVAGETAMRFFSKAGGSSKIMDRGEDIILCVSLDDVLKGFHPTFIKMDIEGAEFSALQGAKEIIRQSKPDLAISVYHNIDDFWRIPLMLRDWDLGYHFYMRTHSSCCMETILYAVCDGGNWNV